MLHNFLRCLKHCWREGLGALGLNYRKSKETTQERGGAQVRLASCVSTQATHRSSSITFQVSSFLKDVKWCHGLYECCLSSLLFLSLLLTSDRGDMLRTSAPIGRILTDLEYAGSWGTSELSNKNPVAQHVCWSSEQVRTPTSRKALLLWRQQSAVSCSCQTNTMDELQEQHDCTCSNADAHNVTPSVCCRVFWELRRSSCATRWFSHIPVYVWRLLSVTSKLSLCEDLSFLIYCKVPFTHSLLID